MSLVNDMLNDLDQRRSKHSAAPEALEWMAGQTPVRRQRSYLPLLALIFIATMLAVGFFLWGPLTGYGVDSADRLLAVAPSGDGATPEPAQVMAAAAAEPQLNGSQAILTEQQPEAANSAIPSSQQHSLPRQAGSAPPPAVQALAVPMQQARDNKLQTPVAVSSTDAGAPLDSAKTSEVAAPRAAAEIAAVARGPVKTSRPRSPAQRDEDVAGEGRELIRRQSVTGAKQLLRQQLVAQPNSPASATLLASVLLSQKHYDQVALMLQQQRAVNPRHIGLLQIEARLLLSTHRAEQALELLLTRQPAVTEYGAYYELLALAARQNKRFELARGSYRQLLASDPGRGDWWVGLAIVLDQQALPEQARVAYSRGLKTQRIDANLAAYARRRVASISISNR